MLDSLVRFGVPLAAFAAAALLAQWVRRAGARAAAQARAEARRLGLRVEEVVREVPVSYDRGRSWRLRPVTCARYTLPHALPSGAPGWALLLRPGTDDGSIAPSWSLAARGGAPPEALRRLLAEIAAEGTEGFLELEGDAGAVSAYWEESGGAGEARRLHRRLAALSRAMQAGAAPHGP